MKIAHISDSHTGYAQYRLVERKKDFLLAFERAIDESLSRKVDLIIHTGDLFESYQPDMATFSAVIKILQKVKSAGVEFLAITGNHDRALRGGVVPPHRVLEELGLLKFLNIKPGTPVKEQVFLDGDLLIAGFQYLPKRLLDAFKENIFPELSELAAKSKTSILMFHQGIKQYLPYEESYEMDFADLPEGFDYYAGGHVHAFLKENIKGGILSYAGSTEFRSRREAERNFRGFNVFDTEEKKLERIELEGLRPFIVVNCNEENVKEELEKALSRAEESRIPPIVVVDYKFKGLEIDAFSEILKSLEKVSLTLRITKKRIEGEEKELTGGKGKSYTTFLEEFMKEKGAGSNAIKVAKELLDASPEHVGEILKAFAFEMTESERLKEFLDGVGDF